MIRSTNHSSFPKVGESPLDQQLRRRLKQSERGTVDHDSVLEAADEATTLAVAEQSRAFIDIVTDGMMRWSGPLSRLTSEMQGLEDGELFRWFETNFYDRRPVVTGEIVRPRCFSEHEFKVAADVSLKRPVKLVLPGPVTFARMAHDRHYRDRDQLAMAVAGVLAEEVADLRTIGARCFQLDEPMLCRHPEDFDLVCKTSARVFEAAGPEATTIVSTYFGDLSALAGRLGELPGTHVGLDMLSGTANFELLADVADGKGVYLGLFDARTTRQEDAADVAELLEPFKETLVRRDVLVGPNAGLELLPRDHAFEKLLHSRYLVEKLSQEWTWAC